MLHQMRLSVVVVALGTFLTGGLKTSVQKSSPQHGSSSQFGLIFGARNPPERSSGKVCKKRAKMRRRFGEQFCRISSFDFQGKWPQEEVSAAILGGEGPKMFQTFASILKWAKLRDSYRRIARQSRRRKSDH